MAASLCSGSDQVLTPQKGDGSEAGGVICCSICGKMINSQSQIFTPKWPFHIFSLGLWTLSLSVTDQDRTLAPQMFILIRKKGHQSSFRILQN